MSMDKPNISVGNIILAFLIVWLMASVVTFALTMGTNLLARLFEAPNIPLASFMVGFCAAVWGMIRSWKSLRDGKYGEDQ